MFKIKLENVTILDKKSWNFHQDKVCQPCFCISSKIDVQSTAAAVLVLGLEYEPKLLIAASRRIRRSKKSLHVNCQR